MRPIWLDPPHLLARGHLPSGTPYARPEHTSKICGKDRANPSGQSARLGATAAAEQCSETSGMRSHREDAAHFFEPGEAPRKRREGKEQSRCASRSGAGPTGAGSPTANAFDLSTLSPKILLRRVYVKY